MTTSPLDAIQARADAATEGPWRLWRDSNDPENKRGASVETAWSHDAEGEDTDLITDWCAPSDAEFIAHAREDVPKLVAALRAVEAGHQKAPVYDTWASDCGHDDCDSVEAEDGETYCPRSVAAYTCEHCADLSRDNMNGELPDWPCPTIGAIREALG